MLSRVTRSRTSSRRVEELLLARWLTRVNCFFSDSFPEWSVQNAYSSANHDQQIARGRHHCPNCSRSYKHRSHLLRHYRYECGMQQRFECPYCKHRLRQRTHVWTHIRAFHPDNKLFCIDIATNSKLVWQEPRNDIINEVLSCSPSSSSFNRL